MPRVSLTKEQKVSAKAKNLSKWCRGKMAENDVMQKDIAELIGTSGSNVSQCFSRGNVTVEMLIAVCSTCNVPQDELLKVLTL